MSRYLGVLVIVGLLALALPATVAARDDAPAGPTVRYTARTAGVPLAGETEIVQLILDFAPGAQTPRHHHGGQLLVQVIEGEVTFDTGGTQHVYKAGDSFVELAHIEGQATNRTAGRTTVAVSGLLPKGAALTTNLEVPGPGSPPAPVARHLYRTPALAQSGAFEIVQFVLDFAEGAQTPPHTHGGGGPVTVLAGENTFSTRYGAQVYTTGQSFIELPGDVGVARNSGQGVMSVFYSVLLPAGEVVTTNVPGLDCVYFFATRHPLCFGFLSYWEKFGGLAIFGYPLSDEFVSDEGVVSQWFERARFEWHPGVWPARHDVLLGRIGAELMDGAQQIVAGVSISPNGVGWTRN